jgi:hypothetical protein
MYKQLKHFVYTVQLFNTLFGVSQSNMGVCKSPPIKITDGQIFNIGCVFLVQELSRIYEQHFFLLRRVRKGRPQREGGVVLTTEPLRPVDLDVYEYIILIM